MIFGIILPWYIVIVSAWTVYYTTLLGSLALLLEFGWPGHCVFIHSGQESGQQISHRKDYPSNCTHLVPTAVSVIAEEALRFLLPKNRNVLVGPMAQRRRRRRDEGSQEHGRCWRRRGQGRRRARQDDATAGGPLRSLAPLHRRLQQAGE